MKKEFYSEVSIARKEIVEFLSRLDFFCRSRVKDEPVFEIISDGLKLLLQMKRIRFASFLSVIPQTFTFKVTAVEPDEMTSRADEVYTGLVNSGAIAEVLQSGFSCAAKLEEGAASYIAIPISDSTGILGIMILETDAEGEEADFVRTVCVHQANMLALYISNSKLNKRLRNINSLLDQKLAYRTESIKQKKRELQTILDSINTGVFIIDKNTYEIVDVNHYALRLLKFEKLSIIGKNRKQFSPHWNYDTDSELTSSSNSEIGLFSEDGHLVPALNCIKMISLNGQDYLLESFIDISKIKSVERELRNTEYRFRTIFENAAFGMVLTDDELRIVESNNVFRKLAGVSGDELKYRKIHDFVCKDDLMLFNKYFSSGVLINKHNEIRFVDSRNELFWCKITATVLKYTPESVYYKLFMIEDITSVVTSKDALFKHTNLLMGVADATNALLTLPDYEEAIRMAIESLGKASEVDRVYIAKNIGPNGSPVPSIRILFEWHTENTSAVKAAEMPVHFDYVKYFPGWYEELSDGRTIHGHIKEGEIPGIRFIEPGEVKSILIVPILIGEKFWGFIGFDDSKKEKVWTEVEESILKATAAGIGGAIKIKETQAELLLAKEKAENSDKLKSEFLAQMSHEIRTPINSILSFSGLIKDEFEPRLTSEYRSCFNAINKAGDRIIRTVDMILNMSDLQTGSYEVNPAEYNLYESVKSGLSEEFKHKAREKGLDFILHKPQFPTTIKADEYTVNQIFANLVDNALKYTAEGMVEVSFEDAGKNEFVAKISDTGIGISEEFIPRMFEPFTQEEQGYTRRYEGNGLGLALVKKYCDISNVSINVTSSKGKGTTFHLNFRKI